MLTLLCFLWLSIFSASNPNFGTPIVGSDTKILRIKTRTELVEKIEACERQDDEVYIQCQLLPQWDISRVISLENVFKGRKKFNADISKWNTSKVTNMVDVFEGAKQFNVDISKWDTSKVISTDNMFNQAETFNADISNWEISKVTSMSKMFSAAEKFNANIGKWNMSRVKNLNAMFSMAKNFNQNIGGCMNEFFLTHLYMYFLRRPSTT